MSSTPAVERCAVLVAAAALCAAWPRPACAQALRAHVEGGAARAIGGAQARETGWGGNAAVAGELALSPSLGIQVELGAVALSAGDPPADPTLARRGASSAYTFLAGLRARPFATQFQGDAVSAAGFWLDANAGGAQTGGVTRFAFDAHAGFDFVFESAAAGPMVGYVHVLQPDDTLRPDDAHLLVFGVHAMLGRTEKPALPALPPVDGDRDHDGVRDSVDKCPDDPEDKDGFEDDDGCPDPDNDKDTVLDKDDACPLEAGTPTQDPKTNGCPRKDRDGDGIFDDEDKCPDEPEDKDGFQDEDGCPDPDNDKDGIPDATDQCPNEPETVNGYADEDGCPDENQMRVVGDKILLDERIHFETQSSTIMPVSWGLMERVAKFLMKHPEYVTVEVDGYADERGEESYNQKLSEARARSVREMLERYGVSHSRMTSRGFGESSPRAAGTTSDALRENRRVEFTITRGTPPPAKTGAKQPLAPAKPAATTEEKKP